MTTTMKIRKDRSLHVTSLHQYKNVYIKWSTRETIKYGEEQKEEEEECKKNVAFVVLLFLRRMLCLCLCDGVSKN